MSAVENVVCVRIRVSGRVQGVGYRAWAQKAALKLGLDGWVRNLNDGSVEAVARGAKSAADQFVAQCQVGPFLARVMAVDTSACDDAALKAIPSGFRQLATADPGSDPAD
ncbi:MAG: acylphosphatase [Rhodospirillaceae bacterium]|nr:acylphosphatase [Rhodospirillaceae bacterium]